MLEEGRRESSISVSSFVETEPLHSDRLKNPQGKDSNAKKRVNTQAYRLRHLLGWEIPYFQFLPLSCSLWVLTKMLFSVHWQHLSAQASPWVGRNSHLENTTEPR